MLAISASVVVLLRIKSTGSPDTLTSTNTSSDIPSRDTTVCINRITSWRPIPTTSALLRRRPFPLATAASLQRRNFPLASGGELCATQNSAALQRRKLPLASREVLRATQNSASLQRRKLPLASREVLRATQNSAALQRRKLPLASREVLRATRRMPTLATSGVASRSIRPCAECPSSRPTSSDSPGR